MTLQTWDVAGFCRDPGPSSLPPRGKPRSPHLRDNGLVLFNSLPFFLTAHDVRSGQRQRLPVPTENRLALAHIRRGQGEGPSWVRGIMLDMTEDSSASKFLPRGSKFPGIQRAQVKTQTQPVRVTSANSAGGETQPGFHSASLTKATWKGVCAASVPNPRPQPSCWLTARGGSLPR